MNREKNGAGTPESTERRELIAALAGGAAMSLLGGQAMAAQVQTSAGGSTSSGMRRKDILVDVSSSVALPGPLHLAASVYYPNDYPNDSRDTGALPNPPIVIFASPGGGFTRGYYDLRFANHRDYSQAEHHVARGMIVVAYDHLGVGDSSIPDPSQVTIEMLAAANDAMVRSVARQLAQGTLTPDLPPLASLRKVGIGQSMGGCVTIVMQGRHATFDAIASLGYSAIHTVRPLKDPAMRQAGIDATAIYNRQTDVRTIKVPARVAVNVEIQRYYHHWEDVEPDILKADTPPGDPFQRSGDWPPYWRSATLPNCALIMLSPGCVAVEAAAISVPVLTAMGERDVCPNPHAEVAAYSRSRDVSLYVVPRMAHMHNFASTRRLMWKRVADWASRTAV